MEAFCSPNKKGPWRDAQWEQIGSSLQAVWGSSFDVGRMTFQTNQLLQIKEVANTKNTYPQEYEAEVHRKKKTLVHLLKQFHACYYWLHEKSMTHSMVGLQGLHLGKAFIWPNISAGIGVKSFCPWYLKLGRNTETITIHLREVHYRMVIVCDICQHEHTECPRPSGKMQGKTWQRACGAWRTQRGLEVPQEKKSKSLGQKGASESIEKSCWVKCCFMSSPLPPSQSSEWMLIPSLHCLNFVFEQALTQSDELSHPFH